MAKKKEAKAKQESKSMVLRTPPAAPAQPARSAAQEAWTEMDRRFEELRREMEQLFWSPWAPSPSILDGRLPERMFPASALAEVRMPTMDIIDKGSELVVHAEMPGIDKDRIEINVLPMRIEISGEAGQGSEQSADGYIRQERSYSQFYRAMPLPEDVIPEKAQARLENGVLQVSLPKKSPKPAAKRHKVSVK